MDKRTSERILWKETRFAGHPWTYVILVFYGYTGII